MRIVGLLLALQILDIDVLTNPDVWHDVKETQSYFLYNTIVQIPIYHCFFDVAQDFSCEKRNYGKTTKPYIQRQKKCTDIAKSTLHPDTAQLFSIDPVEAQVTLCESSGLVKLVEHKMVFSRNKEYEYSTGHCNYRNVLTIWNNNTCLNLVHLYNGSFDVYTEKESREKYIRFNCAAIQLKETTTFCGLEMQKTNISGLVIFSSFIKTSKSLKLNAENNNCEVTTKNNIVALTKTWYLYSYLKRIEVYHCLFDSGTSCDTLPPGEYTLRTDENLLNRCETFCQSTTCRALKVCEQSMVVDLQKDVVTGLASDCKYSGGECNYSSSFWYDTERCGTIQQVQKRFNGDCSETGCAIKNSDSTEVTLSSKGILCDEKVWFTDRARTVASEKQIEFKSKEVHPKKETAQSEDMVAMNQNETVDDIEMFINCLIVLVIVCVVWYIFNVIINFASLWLMGKKRGSKSKLYLLNCLSQSLTNRYIFLDSVQTKNNEPVAMPLQDSHMYEYIENNL